MDIVEVAERIAEDVLFPAALGTDASDAVPVELLDAMADAGLYGIAAPRQAGGLDADFATVCAVQEALASGCLTTAFLWAQHISLVRALAAADDPALTQRWLGPLASGEIRAGLALGGALPTPTLRAEPVKGGWLLDGVSPFVSGWRRVDIVHAAARSADGHVVWLLVDAVEGAHVRAERLRLAALNATATVRLTFDQLPVPADRATGSHPASDSTPPEVLRMHAAQALGVAVRCTRLLGPSSLDLELASLRAKLDRLGPDIAVARAAAGELAVRAACALMTAEGSRSLLVAGHAQRLAREAVFTLVYALRPASRAAVLAKLGAPELSLPLRPCCAGKCLVTTTSTAPSASRSSPTSEPSITDVDSLSACGNIADMVGHVTMASDRTTCNKGGRSEFRELTRPVLPCNHCGRVPT